MCFFQSPAFYWHFYNWLLWHLEQIAAFSREFWRKLKEGPISFISFHKKSSLEARKCLNPELKLLQRKQLEKCKIWYRWIRWHITSILRDYLGVRKLSAWWVPRLLTNNFKSKHVTISKEYLVLFSCNTNELLRLCVTTDETWINHI